MSKEWPDSRGGASQGWCNEVEKRTEALEEQNIMRADEITDLDSTQQQILSGERTPQEPPKGYRVWECKVVVAEDAELPAGFDSPPRQAAQEAVEKITPVLSCFSGWDGTLDKWEVETVERFNNPQPEKPDEPEGELKPCPSCGGIATKEDSGLRGEYKRHCHKCGLQTCWWHSKQEADEAWNCRVDSEEVPRLRSQLGRITNWMRDNAPYAMNSLHDVDSAIGYLEFCHIAGQEAEERHGVLMRSKAEIAKLKTEHEEYVARCVEVRDELTSEQAAEIAKLKAELEGLKKSSPLDLVELRFHIKALKVGFAEKDRELARHKELLVEKDKECARYKEAIELFKNIGSVESVTGRPRLSKDQVAHCLAPLDTEEETDAQKDS